jgi:FAD/FMN-containing dehydrogenase
MNKINLTGRVIRSGDPGWETARRGFDLAAPYEHETPIAVVFCQSEQDVANAILYCRDKKIPIRARCGRHNYQAYSSLCKGGVIVDVSEMNAVSISPDKTTATVGAGLQMVDILERLGEVGMTFPLATGPSVGLAGLTLGGGFGITSRKWGLTCDNLLSLRIALPDGTVVVASATEHPDIFWACRGGGGGNIGVVTEFTFKVYPIGLVAIFTIDWTWNAFNAVVDKFQQWAPDTDENMTAVLALISQTADTPGQISLYGQYTPDDPTQLANVNTLLGEMLSVTPPRSVNIQVLPAEIATRVILGVDPLQPSWRVNKHSDNQIFKSTSAFAHELFPQVALDILRSRLENVPPLDAPPSQPTMVQLLAGGGAVAKVGLEETPIAHRGARIVVQYDGYWTSPTDRKETIKWVEDLRHALLPWAYGAYINYIDKRVSDMNRASFGEANLTRLRQIKHHYDPDNLFDFPQGWLTP